MKIRSFCFYASVALAALLLAGCWSSSSSDESTCTVSIVNSTGSVITAVYVDPYDASVPDPTGKNVLADGTLADGGSFEKDFPEGDYMIYYSTASGGSWLPSILTARPRIGLTADSRVTFTIYSDHYDMTTVPRAAQGTAF